MPRSRYVYNAGSTSSLIPLGTSAELLSVSATGASLGDMQFGGSYQINSGESGWPIFVGNFLFKTVTGVSPFDVPIITLGRPERSVPGGHPEEAGDRNRVLSAAPSVTVLLPTAPGVLFANLQYVAQSRPDADDPGPAGRPAEPGQSAARRTRRRSPSASASP